MKNTVEICAGCGVVSKSESKRFHCAECGSEVSVVISRDMFAQLVKAGVAKQQ